MKILAIETSCDETSVSVLEGGPKQQKVSVLSNVVSSQVELHSKWGGVVPNLAAREHLKNIIPVLDQALGQAKTKIEQTDLFAVTQGPGLIPALLIGTNTAKTLSYLQKKPLLGIHHVEGHIFGAFGSSNSRFKIQDSRLPVLALIVSGGHTQLILMKDYFQYEIIGQTHDDAAGEAFDKVAKMLDLGYPGGPVVSSQAAEFQKTNSQIKDPAFRKELGSISFPRPMMNSGDLDFSFSGLKTSVLYFFKELEKKKFSEHKMQQYKKATCFAFQEAVIDVLAAKAFKAVEKYSPATLLVAGGVAANKSLVKELQTRSKKQEGLQFISPKLEYCGDNAAMIGVAAFFRYCHLQKKHKLGQMKNNWSQLEANANLKLQNI